MIAPPGMIYTECPDCLHDGPHEVHGYTEVECSNCYHLFLNPHV